MKLKNLSKLNVLGKKEQKSINGGGWIPSQPVILCFSDADCPAIPGFTTRCQPIDQSEHRYCHVKV